MHIIPVIDLKDGCVVHARKGQRNCYRPIQTPLCSGSSPHAVIDGLLGLHDFKTLYVADLDALMGTGNHQALLERLQANYSGLEFWIDQGVSTIGPPFTKNKCVPVIGSESLTGKSLGVLPRLGKKFILSLDFTGEGLLGEESLLKNSGLWPETVIIMSLSRVGANEGPDFHRLEHFRANWSEKHFIAAGGVRNADDLIRLGGLGVRGALVASALHSGALSGAELRRFR